MSLREKGEEFWQAVSALRRKPRQTAQTPENDIVPLPFPLEVRYLPRIALEDGRLVGVEAVPHVDKVLPDFSGTASEGEVAPGELLLATALAQVHKWRQQENLIPLPTVNIVCRRLGDFSDESLRLVLDQCGLDPACLELSFSQQSLATENGDTVRQLYALKELGVSLCLEDYGTGSASLELLCQLPIDRLKIAARFIAGIREDPVRNAMVRAIIGLARGLGLKTLADGVETMTELEFVRREGCDEIQGAVYHPALRPEEMEALLRSP